ncbi:hypothetical protein Cst_c10170 [Thermoclostridium stercorarium subsp. stercorarium DSM 8532]|uniref:Uncharacterized protein n=1 Tax=Thermoclostridium stercorarium (strain ATCC 35414 / DSM 8532 / NCIMB 11754) TaxID=1121335 RepID=L7VIV9_THES1|nr:CD3324 family protein [Thermoclostridium stercorarium]AGC68015.1 hypothetical protein Cst_c10170 [Thermoclostridium stercorarium subsp. stercorarium DSM 8532]AGI39049.1 hypothetical protein Clst_0975 [Thermoclostridium stercorarium subsp. stercorarium DSM 8532]
MKYNNARDLLPEWLLQQIQVYVQGEVLYIPKKESVRLKWGEANGTRKFYMKRNMEIIKKIQERYRYIGLIETVLPFGIQY